MNALLRLLSLTLVIGATLFSAIQPAANAAGQVLEETDLVVPKITPKTTAQTKSPEQQPLILRPRCMKKAIKPVSHETVSQGRQIAGRSIIIGGIN